MSDNKAKDAPVSELGQKLQKALNPEGAMPKAVKKKGKRLDVEVSKTNFNRVKFGSHSLAQVLALEGYETNESSVVFAGEPVNLDSIDLVIKQKLIPSPRAS